MTCVLHTEAYRRRMSILAGLLMRGRDPGGMTILLGVGGAPVSGVCRVPTWMVGRRRSGWLIMAVMGAI